MLKLPVGNENFAVIKQKGAELVVTAENHQEFLKEVAKGLGCAEVSKEAVLEALESLEAHVLYIKTQRLEEFGALERIISGFRALFKR